MVLLQVACTPRLTAVTVRNARGVRHHPQRVICPAAVGGSSVPDDERPRNGPVECQQSPRLSCCADAGRTVITAKNQARSARAWEARMMSVADGLFNEYDEVPIIDIVRALA